MMSSTVRGMRPADRKPRAIRRTHNLRGGTRVRARKPFGEVQTLRTPHLKDVVAPSALIAEERGRPLNEARRLRHGACFQTWSP